MLEFMDLATVGLGFVFRLVALNQQSKAAQNKLLIEALNQHNDVIKSSRDYESKETPSSSFRRTFLFLSLIMLLIFSIVVPPIMGWSTSVEIIDRGISILGLPITTDSIEYVEIAGWIEPKELYSWIGMIVEFYVGKTLASKR